MDFVKKLKEWLDGSDLDDYPLAPSPASSAPQSSPAKQEGGAQKVPKREEFIVRVAREIAKVMEEEKMEIPPDGEMLMPSKYVIFLSKEDDAQWQGRIREGLEKGLYNLVSQRAKELIGDKPSSIKSLTLDIHVDGSLETGKVNVRADWDDEEKTRILAKTGNTGRAKRQEAAAETPVDRDEDKTIVKPRNLPALFSLAVLRPGEAGRVHKLYKDKITVGRSEKADLMLEGDRQISRIHIEIERLGAGRYKVTCLGQNGVEIGESWVDQNHSKEIAPGEAIKVETYELKIAE